MRSDKKIALAQAFLDALPETRRKVVSAQASTEHGSPVGESHQLESCLEQLVAKGQAAHPDLSIDAEAFVAHVAANLNQQVKNIETALLDLHAADLVLAYACTCNIEQALSEVMAATDREIVRAIDRAARSRPAAQREELAQELRQKLFVGDEGTKPRIASYAGLGPLAGWVRVAAMRAGIDLTRSGAARKPEQPLSDALAGPVGSSDNAELAYMQKLYRDHFKQALASALDDLSPRERNLLRHHLLRGVTVDQLATLYGAHRATLARWVAAARETLVAQVRRRLAEELDIPRVELDSVFRLIDSQLDMSLHRILGAEPEAES